jgi:hypothetical protein
MSARAIAGLVALFLLASSTEALADPPPAAPTAPIRSEGMLRGGDDLTYGRGLAA